MRIIYILLLFVLSNFNVFSQSKLSATPADKFTGDIVSEPAGKPVVTSNAKGLNDSVPQVPDVSAATGAKVIMSDAEYSLEFSPYSPQRKSALIQPIDRVDNKGVTTSFYLHDTARWKFYTNSSERLTIGGNGNITTHTPLLINDALPDNSLALRVNGNARFDSSLSVMSAGDDNSFISFSRGFKSAWDTDGDGITPYTSTPTDWADKYGNLPVFRLRHPNNVASSQSGNMSVKRDFMILPYEYGMAIDYNGVVECWVGEWSIHKGVFYQDVEGKGNGWGAVLWVGDDVDGGGLRATSRNNIPNGGNVKYGELSVENFQGGSQGDFRLRLPSVNDAFQFVYGERGSTNVVASLSDKGLVLPIVTSVASIASPQKGQILFDNASNEFKGFNGTLWVSLANSNNTGKTGHAVMSGNGSNATFAIPHGLKTTPSFFNVIPTSQPAGNIAYLTVDAVNIYIHYTTGPASGNENLSWNWEVK